MSTLCKRLKGTLLQGFAPEVERGAINYYLMTMLIKS
jgi:hypothetical protein